MSDRKTISVSLKDRKLGDEWAEWDGTISETNMNVEAGKRLFFGFAFIATILMSIGAFLLWYLIEPRLSELNVQLANLVRYSILGVVIFLFLWLCLNVLSVLMDKNLLVRFCSVEMSITFFGPLVMRLSKRFGVNKDKMGHSFVKVSNSLIYATKKNLSHVKLLILLPHCLQRSIRIAIKELAEKYHISAFVASGGEIARKIIVEQQPTAIIGIACERDLVSGIQDVINKIPVIGIPNKRPEGPCKNTTVNFTEVEEAIQFFLGYKSPEVLPH